jgi:hypothetical protein
LRVRHGNNHHRLFAPPPEALDDDSDTFRDLVRLASIRLREKIANSIQSRLEGMTNEPFVLTRFRVPKLRRSACASVATEDRTITDIVEGLITDGLGRKRAKPKGEAGW